MSKAILDEQNKRKETLMNDERREYIRDQLYQETGDPESQAWRDELTPEEMEYVERLDGRYATGIAAMCAAILVREKVRERYRPEEIAELKTVYGHCRLRLRSGEVFLARWAPAGGLRLEKIVGEGDGNARCSA